MQDRNVVPRLCEVLLNLGDIPGEGGHFGLVWTGSTWGFILGRPRGRVVDHKPVCSQVSSVHSSLPYGRLRMTESRIAWSSFFVNASLTPACPTRWTAERPSSEQFLVAVSFIMPSVQ